MVGTGGWSCIERDLDEVVGDDGTRYDKALAHLESIDSSQDVDAVGAEDCQEEEVEFVDNSQFKDFSKDESKWDGNYDSGASCISCFFQSNHCEHNTGESERGERGERERGEGRGERERGEAADNEGYATSSGRVATAGRTSL